MTTESAPGTHKVTQKRSKIHKLPIVGPSIISSHSTYNVWYSGTSLWQVPLQKTSSASFVALLPFFFAPEQIVHPLLRQRVACRSIRPRSGCNEVSGLLCIAVR